MREAPVSAALVLASSVSPVGAAASDIVTYVLGYGVLGIAVVMFALRVIVPRSAVDDARAQARVDLLEENRRLIAEKTRAEEQRDEALRIAQTQLVPLLTSFTATTTALLPLLQELVSMRESPRAWPGRREG
jgi:hypothetical protein